MLFSYRESLYVTYVSSKFSKATCFNFLVFFISIVFPYIIAYRSQGFWRKLEKFHEQPKVLWKKEIIVFLEGKENHNSKAISLVWTTIPGLRSMISTNLAPEIMSREGDYNYDSVKDFLDIELRIPLPNSSTVEGVHLMLLFEYRLHKYAIMEMESMIYVNHQATSAVSKFEFVGDMGLVQKEPLRNRQVDTRYTYDVIPRHSSKLSDYDLGTILRRYAYRNCSTILKNEYKIWTPREDSELSNYKSEITISGRINYYEETYECWAGISEVLKWAWIQYFAIFVIIYTVLRAFQSVVHRARFFDTYLLVPWES